MSQRGKSMRLGGLVFGLVVVLGTALSGVTPSLASQGGVAVWLTDLGTPTYLGRQADLSWRAGEAPSDSTIGVDEHRKYQEITGFGASFTDSSAWLVGTRLDSAKRAAVMRDLFGTKDGIGLSLVRQPMGASDFSTIGNYSYDDVPPGENDPNLEHFSIEHDKAYILPVLREAMEINPRLTIMASPWSPPGWMKTSDSMVGGNLEPDAYQPLADYSAKFIEAYDAEGVPVHYITPNNEPLYIPAGYPGLGLSAEEASDLIQNNLGPTLRRHGLTTQILGYDHNWDVTSYPETMYADLDTAQYVAGTAWHCYGGDVRAQALSHNNYPNKQAFHTECSGGEWEGDEQAALLGGMHLVVNSTRDWAQGVVRWNMALDAENGPTNGGCLTCRGVVTIAPNANGEWSYTKTIDYYVLGHASKFVRPGARRIASNTLGSGDIEDVAFENPDGSKALVAFNSGDARKTFRVQWGSRWFEYALNAGAAATFTWNGDQAGPTDPDLIGSVDLRFRNSDGTRPTVSYDAGLGTFEDQVRVGDTWLGATVPTGGSFESTTPGEPLAREGWTVTASASAPEDPAGNAIDGDPATRWSTGHGMEPGDWFDVDLGSSQPVNGIVMDTTASAGDFARTYEVYVSDDGESWGDPVARGPGRTVTGIAFPAVEARYVRLVNTGSSGSWWSIHELDVLSPQAAAAAAAPTATSELGQAGGDLQERNAELPDGTKLRVVYNAGRSLATFEVARGETTYVYRLPATAAAIFTERPVG